MSVRNRPRWCPKCQETHDASRHKCPVCGTILEMFDE